MIYLAHGMDVNIGGPEADYTGFVSTKFMSTRNCEDDLKMTFRIRVAPKSNEWHSYKERDRNIYPGKNAI